MKHQNAFTIGEKCALCELAKDLHVKSMKGFNNFLEEADWMTD